MESAGIQTTSVLQQSLQQQSMVGTPLLSSIGTVEIVNVGRSGQQLDKTATDPLPLKSVIVLETLDQLIVESKLNAKVGNQSSLLKNTNSQTDPLVGLSDQSTITGAEGVSLNDQSLSGTSKDNLSQIDSQIDRDFQQLEELLNTAAQLEQVKALDSLRLVAPTDLGASLDFGLGKTSERGSTIGQIPFGGGNSALFPHSSGFDNPLDGHRNSRPSSTLLGAGSIPGMDGLVSQDRGEPVRQSDRHSDDGRTTYGHTTYADGSRRAERIYRHDDGSTTTTSMTWGSDGRVVEYGYSGYDDKNRHISVETTRINDDGTETVVGMELDENGEIVRTWGTDQEKPHQEKPQGSAKSVDPDSSTGGSNVNPLTGQYVGEKPKTSNDQVNPNLDAPKLATSGLNFDERKLVVNPPLNATTGNASFDPNRFISPNQVKPPEPEF